MESRNPVFGRTEGFQRGGYATFDTRTPSASELEQQYYAPSATSVDTNRMTLDDVVMRTAMLFGALLLTAAPTYLLVKPEQFMLVIGAGLVGFVVAMVAQFKKMPSPPLMLGYALIEGVFVGGISKVYVWATGGSDIVIHAIVGTLCAFGAMLALYKTGVIRNSPKFQKTLMIAGVGYMLFGLVHFLGVMFNWWSSVYSGGGLLPIALSVFGVLLASFFLVLDFDFVEQGIRNGIPKIYAWTAAFGLVVTLVWLYLEILRLLSILRGGD
jgi:uncharacterized YccA/Bax inhibitor family protein